MATYPQPQETQQIHQATSVQDGVASSHASGTTTQLVGCQPGSEGRLPPGSHPSFLQKMAGFRHRRRDLPFQVPPVRPLYSPPHIHQGVKVIAEHLRRQGVYVFIYLDDWLPMVPSPEILRDQVRMVANLVQRLGVIVNFQKSTLQPSQKVQFLGSQLDFTKGMVFPTEDRVQSVIQCASLLLQEVAPPARLWMRMLGLIASLKCMLPQSILRMQIIQLHVLGRFRSHKDSLSRRIRRTTQVSNALSWGTQPSNVRRGKKFVPLPPSSTLTTDASKAGWGAHWGNIQLSGMWSPSLAKKRINLLELWAIHLALRRLRHYLRGQTVLVKCDMSVVMYITKKGGVRSRSLCFQRVVLLKWCQRYHITLQAAHLQGADNKLADALSRKALAIKDKPGIRGSSMEWHLNPIVCRTLFNRLQRPPHRPVCQQSKQPAPNLLQLGRRPDGICPGCDDDQLGHDIGLCLPTDCSHPQSPGEDHQLQVVRHDPDHSQVAYQPWFPRLLSLLVVEVVALPLQGPHLDRRWSPSSSPDSSGAESDCMANFIRSYKEAGLSSEAAAIAGEVRRPSTRRTYNTRIRKYFKWCRRAAVNPHSASLGQVCDFLTAIFKEEGATVYSVRPCRTGVAAVHHGFG